MSQIKVAEEWKDVENPVRNTGQKYLKFLNTSVFQDAGRHFLKYGYYTDAPFGSKDYIDYWDEQENRVLNGYSVGGVRITGRHYFYINFTPIKARPIDPNTGLEKEGETRKIITLPRFLDHNYYFFHEFERAAAEGAYAGKKNKEGMIIAKSRRKGMSYMTSGGIFAYNFNFLPASMNLLAAFEKGHYKVLLDGIHFAINSINRNTDWAKKQGRLSKRDHFRASFVIKNPVTGVDIEDGYMSEIQAISFKDNPFRSIGESVDLMVFEEAGKFENLMTAYTISEPTFRDGDIMTGIPLIFGCLTKNNKVFTGDGRIITPDKLQLSDSIAGYDSNKASIDNIEHINPPAKKECIRMTTTGGHILECSTDHPVLWSNRGMVNNNALDTKFIEAGNVKENDYLLMPDEIPIFGNKRVEYARMLGMLIGDGNYSNGQNGGVVLYSNDNEIVDYTLSNYQAKLQKRIKGNHREIYLNGFAKVLREHNMMGQSKCNKRFPDDLHEFDKQSLAEFISGIFDTDGNVVFNEKKKRVRIALTSACPDILKEIQLLLMKFGIESTIVKEKHGNGGYTGDTDIFRLYIAKNDSVKKFHNEFSLLCNKHTEHLSHIRNIKVARHHGKRKNGFNYIGNNTKEDTSFFDDKSKLNNIHTVRVVKVEYIGLQEIYNVTVSNTHTYLASGFITHNTGGSMEKGTKDFAEMFYNPEPYGLVAYDNIYDENATGKCGWFIDDAWYYPGEIKKKYIFNGKTKYKKMPLVDVHGNSIRELAMESLLDKRAKRKGGSRRAYNKFITQQPLTPSEAFLRAQGTAFDTVRASARLSEILTNQKKYIDSIWIAKLLVDPTTSTIKFDYDPDGIPIREFPIKDNNQAGAIEIYEMPVKDFKGEVPYGRYIAGIDPYDDDRSTTNSVGSILVLDMLTDRIVCHYKGRPETANQLYETFRRILKFYNATANYERNKKGLYGYFYNKTALHLLVDEPRILREKGLSKSSTFGNDSKGVMATTAINWYGIERSVQWMSERAYGEDNESEVTNLDKIRSIPLLKEIIAWNPDDNFDDVSALGMLMILREDRLNFRSRLIKKEINTVTSDPFFDRNFKGQRNSYTDKTIMDFIKTSNVNT